MKNVLQYRRSVFTLLIIISGVFLFTKCVNKESEKGPVADTTINDNLNVLPAEEKFAGSASCANCHKDIYDKHVHTAHYLTSRPASTNSIMGSFKEGHNTFTFSQTVSIVMEKKDSSFYQVEYVNGTEKKKKRFDIVIGSGTRGQTYLYWEGNNLFQLPIFYFTGKDEWANSPGYSGRVIYNRPITSRCLECHSTYARKLQAGEKMPETFSHVNMVLGVDCEKCHGSAVEHVAFHTKNPKDSIGRFIINPAKFSRQQKLDMCALCHGGRLSKTKPSFTFTPGDTLANFFTRNTNAPHATSIDVHGNQYGLLSVSKCFRNSDMTCNNCHNPHANEKGKTELYSQRCMSCHNTAHGKICKLTTTEGTAINKNCIDCHMPEQSSRSIIFLEQRKDVPASASMRTHFIAMYPEETKKVLALIRSHISHK